MAESKSLEHAGHNEKVCKYLDRKPAFLDWVITTAFYSAMHYLEHKLFPLKMKNGKREIKMKNFEEYYMLYGKDDGRHKAFSKLVEREHPDISDDYNKLKDISWTARYHKYQYNRTISNHAKTMLDNIKTDCLK